MSLVHFLWFCPTRDTTGRTLADLIIGKLGEWGPRLEDLVGQGCDGAGNMSDRVRGVQALISANFPAAVYVHCKNHCFNLAMVHSTRIPTMHKKHAEHYRRVGILNSSVLHHRGWNVTCLPVKRRHA